MCNGELTYCYIRDEKGIKCIECISFCKNNQPIHQQFNYECPDCHGKFNIPGYKNDGTSAFTQVCPFCNRKMEGL